MRDGEDYNKNGYIERERERERERESLRMIQTRCN